MKRFLLIGIVFSLIACSSNLDELNENLKVPETVPGEALFTSAQKSLVDQMTNSSVNNNVFRLFAQHWTETVYTDETNYEIVNRNIPQNHWRILYRDVLKDLDQATIELNKASTATPEEAAIKSNKLIIAEILKIFTYSILVETFGDIPYSEALAIETKLPAYDDGLTIYKDLIARLEVAIISLNGDSSSFDANDNIYSGDISKWFLFANSLKLRMGIMISDIPNENDFAKKIVSEAAPNVFKSNSDNALFKYLGATPNTNQLYVDLIASGRNDFVPANTFVNFLNNLEDPRRMYYFDSNIDDPTTPEVEYKGGTYGKSASFPINTHVNPNILVQEYPGTLLNFTEIQFLLAEAAEKGLVGTKGDAERYYNSAIIASFLDWGGTEQQANEYLDKTEVDYKSDKSGATWQEKIGNQAWIGLYNRGYEAWTSWRRLDFPTLSAPPEAISVIPVRYTYPVNEQTLNPTNYANGSLAIGGDSVGTKLFWDIN